MTGYSAANYISNANRTQGEGKAFWESHLQITKEHGLIEKAETVASDIFALTDGYTYYVLSGQGGAADNLKAITATNGRDGHVVVCAIANTGQPITFQHNITGAGKLKNSDNIDFVMTALEHRICYRYKLADDIWYEMWRQTGGGLWNIVAKAVDFSNSDRHLTFYEIDTTAAARVVTMLDTAPLGTEHCFARTAGANQITFNRSGTNNLFVLGQTLTTIAYSDDSTIRWIKRSTGWHVS